MTPIRRPETQMPLTREVQSRVSRRSLLALAAALPLLPFSESAAPAAVRPTRLVMRGGWVLRSDDLERLAIA